jgi:Mg-chelatase subunit ChlD
MKTEIIIITDTSGSMGLLAADAAGGINAFIDEQRQLPGEAKVTHYAFDSSVRVDFSAKPIADVPTVKLMCTGMTAMNDAIGTALEECGKRIADEKWADQVIVLITTDGQENSSTRYTPQRVREMVQHAEANGWKFIFAAANQDAVMSAQMYGINNGLAANYQATPAGTRDVYASMSATVTSLRAGGPAA